MSSFARWTSTTESVEFDVSVVQELRELRLSSAMSVRVQSTWTISRHYIDESLIEPAGEKASSELREVDQRLRMASLILRYDTIPAFRADLAKLMSQMDSSANKTVSPSLL